MGQWFFNTGMYLLSREVRARRLIKASLLCPALDAKVRGLFGSDEGGGSSGLEKVDATGCDADCEETMDA